MTNSLLASLLGSVAPVFIGPAVNCVGCESALLKKPGFSRIAQTFSATLVGSPREEVKRKYLPPGVQIPSCSEEGVLQAGSSACRLVPSDLTSHKEVELLFGSNTVKRS